VEHNWSYMCKTLTPVCTAAVHADQTLVYFSLLEHSFQNSTHSSHEFKHNLHSTVNLQHFVQMLTLCCQNCEPHIQNRINFSLVPFTLCWFSNNFSWTERQGYSITVCTFSFYLFSHYCNTTDYWSKLLIFYCYVLKM